MPLSMTMVAGWISRSVRAAATMASPRISPHCRATVRVVGVGVTKLRRRPSRRASGARRGPETPSRARRRSSQGLGDARAQRDGGEVDAIAKRGSLTPRSRSRPARRPTSPPDPRPGRQAPTSPAAPLGRPGSPSAGPGLSRRPQHAQPALHQIDRTEPSSVLARDRSSAAP